MSSDLFLAIFYVEEIMDGLRYHPLHESIWVALRGIIDAVKTERNIKIELGFALIAVLAGFFFGITKSEWLSIIIMIFAVVSAEIINTAIEATCNCLREKLGLEYGVTQDVRDIAAGGVMLLAIGSIIVGLVIFLPYLLRVI